MLKPTTATKRTIFGIEPAQVRVSTRGFRVSDASARTRIELIGRSFVHGYDAALVATETAELVQGLDVVDWELRGFAFEGAAMASTLLDELGPGRRRRWKALAEGAGDAHLYMLYVGAGWAFARLPRGAQRLGRFVAHTDPLLCWLAVDGYGFHHGFFGSQRALGGWRPRLGEPYAARAFDQGLGRSLWFVEGADVDRIARRVTGFAPDRHGDLWSGVGLACAYAGILADEDLHRLRTASGAALAQLQQGVAFAATARWRAGNTAEHTEKACRVLCGASVEELATLTQAIRAQLEPTAGGEDYERWRQQVASLAGRARAW